MTINFIIDSLWQYKTALNMPGMKWIVRSLSRVLKIFCKSDVYAAFIYLFIFKFESKDMKRNLE
jgi:hypothetical protein